MNLTKKQFETLAKIIYNKSGIHIPETKSMMIVSRLNSVLLKHSLKNYDEYIKYVKQDLNGERISELLNAVSTNLTYFYRESKHFEFFKTVVLPEMSKEEKKYRELRIWSAGCSTGEEPYTLSIIMNDFFGENYKFWNAGVLATDIDTNVILTAKQGVYTPEKLAKLPPVYKLSYFVRLKDGNFKLRKEIVNDVLFKRFSLMNPFPFKKQFHAIFCRNVMIYFDKKTVENLIKKFYKILLPGGYLFIGHSETINRAQNKDFEYIMPACYRKIK